jgi:hypothetical protein
MATPSCGVRPPSTQLSRPRRVAGHHRPAPEGYRLRRPIRGAKLGGYRCRSNAARGTKAR